MQKDVRITIVGTQTDEAGTSSQIVQRLTGEYFEKNDSVYLLYEETDPESGEITKNQIKITGLVLSHTKRGRTEAQMIFEAGQSYPFFYKSPFGQLHMAVTTEAFTLVGTELKKTIRLEYDLSADGSHISHNQITIKIKENY